MTTDFTDDDAMWINDHVTKVVASLRPALERHGDRFPDHLRLITRLESAAKAVIDQRR
jgi:hypothetical protein